MNTHKLKTRSAALALGLLLIIGAASCSKNKYKSNKVEYGKFTQTITETGELHAINTRAFVMPRFGRYWYSMKVIGMLDHGTAVEAGDSIIQLDPADINKFIIDRETQFENEKANLTKLIVQQENRISDLQSAFKTEEATFNLKKLEMEQFRFESEKTRKIKELEFKQAEINFNKVKLRMELNKIISDNELKIQQIRVNQISKEVKEAKEILPKLTIRTPIPGIFQVARKRRSRESYKIGDEIDAGTNMGNVPDLTWMKAVSTVNETDIDKINLGQKVNVRLDALPNVAFEGEITYVSKLCRQYENNNKRKVFDVEVKLKDSDERLKPGMTVSCEFITASVDDVFFAPNGCIDLIDKRHYVYIKKNTGYDKVEVKLGARNNTHTVVQGNIKQGADLIPVNQINQRKSN
jgi:multidrug efflux pump subunit AcrA (membrane-fusion protein)